MGLTITSCKEIAMRNEFDISNAGGLVPMVVEQSARGERSYDIYSRLLKVLD